MRLLFLGAGGVGGYFGGRLAQNDADLNRAVLLAEEARRLQARAIPNASLPLR